MMSNGSVVEALATEIPAPLDARRAGLRDFTKGRITDIIHPSRAVAVAGDVLELSEGICCGEIPFDTCVKLLGCEPPDEEWEASQGSASRARGTWGQTTGPTASVDVARAMTTLGHILVEVFCDAYGAPKPADPTFGLSDLALTTSRLSAEAARKVFQQLFEAVAVCAPCPGPSLVLRDPRYRPRTDSYRTSFARYVHMLVFHVTGSRPRYTGRHKIDRLEAFPPCRRARLPRPLLGEGTRALALRHWLLDALTE